MEPGDPHLRRSDSYDFLPPYMSELKVVLLGNNWRLKALVGKLLLEETKFVQIFKCEEASGAIKNKKVTVINTPDLLPSTSLQQLNKTVEDLKSLSAPDPHVFLLVLQPEDFSEKHKTKLESVLESFSEQAFNHSLVLICTPRDQRPGFMEKYMSDPQIRDMIIRCRYRYLWMTNIEEDSNLKEFKCKELFMRISQILKEKNEENLTHEPSQEEDTGQTSSTEHKPPLNLVLFGAGSGKSSVVESMLGPATASSPGQCVKHQGEVCGRWVSLVELPALSGKPLEAVMQQCLSCISLCGPEGVHAFILVLPAAPLTDEDKAELKIIQDTFSSAVNPYTMILFTVDSQHTDPAVVKFVQTDKDLQELSQSCGGGYILFHTRKKQQFSELLETVETLMAKNKPQSYTTETLVQAQTEKISALQKDLQEVQTTGSNRSDQGSSNSLRIAIIGKTGTGKSSSGNTLLGTKVFDAKPSQTGITTSCQKEESEVDGRRVAVVDTPGLFDKTLSYNEERLKCVSYLTPGPHVFLLVIPIGRFSDGDTQILELIKKGFGKDVAKFTIVLFTFGDALKHTKSSITEFLKTCDESVKNVLSECGNRFHVFDNSDNSEDNSQVKELLEKIDDIVKSNGGKFYSSDMLVQAEIEIKRKIQTQMETEEKERKREMDQVKRICEDKEAEINTLNCKYKEELREVKYTFMECVNDLQKQLEFTESERKKVDKQNEQIIKEQIERMKQMIQWKMEKWN